MSFGGLGWFYQHVAADTETESVNLAPISARPHTVRHELGCVSTWWIVSHCGHCCGRARPGAVASSFAQRVGLGPAPWCCFSVCCIVSGPLWGGAADRIVLASWGYCPTPMCLFMLLASLSGQPQFHATGPPRSHSRPAPRHRARCFQTRRANVCVCVREKNRIDMSLWVIGEKRKQTLHE